MTARNKIVSYSLFGSRTTEPWLFNFYLRGFVWNVRMNALIYPDWQTHVEVDSGTFSDYDHIFNGLSDLYGISYNINIQEPLCKSMLWRLKPVFWPDSNVVLCRDADAITTWREKKAVIKWIDSKYLIHGMNDNPAHKLPLMGGMVGFFSYMIRETYSTWEEFMEDSVSVSDHGSDQQYLMNKIFNRFKEHVLIEDISNIGSDHTSSLWESDLTCRHIGSAGVVEMETIRFFKRFGDTRFDEVEKKYPNVFYWWL